MNRIWTFIGCCHSNTLQLAQVKEKHPFFFFKRMKEARDTQYRMPLGYMKFSHSPHHWWKWFSHQ